MEEKPEGQPQGCNPRNRSSSEQHQIAVAIDSLKRSYDASDSNRQKNDRQSLKWTRRTAKAAIAYTIMTALLLAAGVYSAIQAWRALNAANQSAEAARDSVSIANSAVAEARRAADAATKQAAIAEDTEKRQLRAYVIFTNAVADLPKENTIPTVHSVFDNIGQTPAYRASWTSGINVVPTGLNILQTADCRSVIDAADARLWYFGKQFFPFKERVGSPYTKEEMDVITNGIAQISFTGRLCYEDIFREVHHIDFCVSWRMENNRLSEPIICERSESAD